MSSSNLTRQVRSVLEGGTDLLSLQELLASVDDFVLECTSSPESEVLLAHLEEDLQNIHHEVFDHSSPYQTEVFLAVLYHLNPILPPTSVISWFDIVFRPALREPKLSTPSVKHAKELIISALQKTEEVYEQKVKEFRRRLMDLYLLDAFNEGSGADVLEWAELNEEQRDKRSHWKRNLEDILLKFGAKRPEDLMTEVYIHFETPGSRLQLLMLLNLYISDPSFSSSSDILAAHPLTMSILRSLMLDTSSTVCTAGLTLLVKLLPLYAVHARTSLKLILGELFAVLSRILIWKERPPASICESTDEPLDQAFEEELEREMNRLMTIPLHPDFKWQRLELTFDATTSLPPPSRPYFTILYYLYPSNVLKFLNSPAQYLIDLPLPSPYTLDWPEALPQDEIRRRSERLLREHVCHPLLVWRDATAELSENEFWAKYTASRITSEASMLDVRNSALGLQLHDQSLQEVEVENDDGLPARLIRPIDITNEKATIALQDMINMTVALKSNLDVEIIHPQSQWPHSLFALPSRLPNGENSEPNEIPSHFVQIISSLQRELLLLRNELNFELWLSRENVQHIGRLYQDRVLAKNAEAERQGLVHTLLYLRSLLLTLLFTQYNKLRNYRAQVVAFEKELREHKQQASSAKNKYAEWNNELQKKLKELRDEKKAWVNEEAKLRKAEKEVKALFDAQGKLLADAQNQVFLLQTQKKETQHKVDRLHDYERQIEQHVKIQRLWDDDFAKFNERKEQMDLMRTQYHQMKMRVESYQQAQVELETSARAQRLRIQALEAQLAQTQTVQHSHHRKHLAQARVASFTTEKAALLDVNKRLKDQNNELKDEVEELRAMIEILKAQHNGHKGLISSPRASPMQFTSSLHPGS
ncbi:hypothetical protein C0995_006923 [Termitomyces sp. Mi166|nr:hypothetical protein C0995_006923 [Termitomyces sp. Mi166\